MGTAMAVLLGGMKMCGSPWDPPIAEAKKEIAKESEAKHEKMNTAAKEERGKIEAKMSEHEKEAKDGFKELNKAINSMWRLERAKRRNGND